LLIGPKSNFLAFPQYIIVNHDAAFSQLSIPQDPIESHLFEKNGETIGYEA